MKDNLQIAASLRKTIKVLIAHIRSLRGFIEEVDTLHQKELKELKKVISKRNKRILTLEQQVNDNKELIHLRGVAENQSAKIIKYIKIINKYEMEKL